VRYLGLDLGRARIGIALADDVLRTARPLEVVPHVSERADLERIAALAREWEVEQAVVGLPLNMDDSEGPAARHARAFAARLGEALAVPVAHHAERLSTFEAQARLRERGLDARSQRARIDAEAAAVILQSWLDGEPA
jgi:putative Holliday junction resolvase